MKKCLSVAVAVGLSGCVTSPADMPINPSDREFSQIYDVPNMSKGQIYEGSLKWIAENFGYSEKSVYRS